MLTIGKNAGLPKKRRDRSILSAARAAGGGGVSAPGVSGSISASTISEGTGTGTIATSQVFTGGSLTYVMEDALSGFAVPGMTINSSNGVITYDRTALRRGLRYIRVTVTNGAGSAFHDFNVFVRYQTFDYVATTAAEWNTIFGNSAATLSGKVIAWDAASTDLLDVPAKSPTLPIIITAASHASRIEQITFNGGGTSTAPAFRVDGAILKKSAYPNANWVVRGSTAVTYADFINSDISHNYQGGILDPAAALPEYNKGQMDSRTATVTSANYALVHRDAAMGSGQVTLFNDGAATVYFALGNSGVTASVASQAVTAGGSANVNFTSLPTHIAIISASGSQAVRYQSEQGLANYVCDAFAAAGGAGVAGNVIGCAIHDIGNGIKGFAATVADNNDIFRVFQDAISVGGNQDVSRTQYITRNRIGLPFGVASYAQNPHSDIVQMFNESAPSAARNIIIAGNIVYPQTSVATVAQVFISDHPGGYYDLSAVGNANFAGNIRGIYVGESPSDFAFDGFAFGNTIFNANSPSSGSVITLLNDTTLPSYAGANIATGFNAGMRENNVTQDSGNVDTILTARSALLASRNYKTAKANYTASVSAGAAWAWTNGVINFSASDHTTVVDWTKVPPGIIWDPVTDVATSSVQTFPWRKVKGGGGTVTPGTGTEWQSSSDGGTTIVQNWTSSAGSITRGHSIRIRRTASGTGNTTLAASVTINGYSHTVDITTAQPAAANFVGRKTYTYQSLGNQTIDLTTVTGGIGSAPATGDLVIVAVSCASSTSRALSFPGDWTSSANLFANSTSDTNLRVGWKIMGGTPDTSVAITASTSGGSPMAVAVHVYRSINATTPMDVAEVTSTITNGRAPNPAAITPVTSGAQLVAIGASAHTPTAELLDHTDLISKTSIVASIAAGTLHTALMVGDVAWTGGAVDLPAFTIGGTSQSTESGAAIVLALRPA